MLEILESALFTSVQDASEQLAPELIASTIAGGHPRCDSRFRKAPIENQPPKILP